MLFHVNAIIYILYEFSNIIPFTRQFFVHIWRFKGALEMSRDISVRLHPSYEYFWNDIISFELSIS